MKLHNLTIKFRSEGCKSIKNFSRKFLTQKYFYVSRKGHKMIFELMHTRGVKWGGISTFFETAKGFIYGSLSMLLMKKLNDVLNVFLKIIFPVTTHHVEAKFYRHFTTLCINSEIISFDYVIAMDGRGDVFHHQNDDTWSNQTINLLN